MGNMTTLSTKGAQNIEKALESIEGEKDLKITRLQDALTKKTALLWLWLQVLKKKWAFRYDIQVNVEKGVVFISIADKLLFKSGSYMVSDRAKEVLAK
jgi:chemotaxis protein MotB